MAAVVMAVATVVALAIRPRSASDHRRRAPRPCGRSQLTDRVIKLLRIDGSPHVVHSAAAQ